MSVSRMQCHFGLAAAVVCLMGLTTRSAQAASCLAQSQMPAPQRQSLIVQAHTYAALVQNGDTVSIRQHLLPAISGAFSTISDSVTRLKPLVQNATFTVDGLYFLDNSTDTPGQQRTQFFCGSPTVVLTFNGIPPGHYALVLLHATGVPKPQQIAVILSSSQPDQWLLAGFYSRPMILADHDGLWYWTSARHYAQNHANFSAWLYYRVAESLLSPVDFLSSPNLQKLQEEMQQIQPPGRTQTSVMTLNVKGGTFDVTNVDTTTAFGGLDVDLHYAPTAQQAGELRTPLTARQQVTALMSELLRQHPELRQAFHGVWAHADQGQANLFALELPMDQIAAPSGLSASTH